MKEDELNEVLRGYYRASVENAKITGTLMHRAITSSIMCIAIFLTFTGLLMTQLAKMTFSYNLITVGIAVIGVILFLLFILSTGYYFALRIHMHNIFGTIMEIEKLQHDILFDEIRQEEIEKRFQNIYPFLSASKYKIEWKSVFRRW